MEMLSPVVGILVAPFVAWWALSWWIIIPCSVSFVISIVSMMSDREDHNDVSPWVSGACIAIIGLLIAIGIGYTSEVQGFWISVLEGAKFFVKFCAIYVACGILTLLPLWCVNVRRIGKRIRKLYKSFIDEALKATEDNKGYFRGTLILTAEQKEEVRACNGMKDGKILECLQDMFSKYKSHISFPSVDARNNMGLITSLLFLWPAHIIVEICGEFIAKIPQHVAKLLRIPLNMISRLAVRGLPEDVK